MTPNNPVVTPPDSIPGMREGGRPFRVSRKPHRKMTFTGLDIGTTKICALIGEIDTTGLVTVLGLATVPSQGMLRGVVTDLDQTVSSIREVIARAEEIAKVRVSDVIVGLAGGYIQCRELRAKVNVTNPERGISRSDIRRVISKAIDGQCPEGQEVLHQIPQRYIIDDGPIMHPEKFCSRELGVEMLMVSAAVTAAQNIVRAVGNAGFRVSGIYLEPLASSLAVLNQDDKELGTLLIDIGGGTSDVAIWAGGSVRYTGVVPFGGDSITEDVHKAMRISRYDAENLKRNSGHCLIEAVDKTEMIDVREALTGNTNQRSRRELANVIGCRAEEILELVKHKVERIPAWQDVHGGIVLTGGTSLQKGIDKLAEEVFDKPCRLGHPTGLCGVASLASSPIFSTGVGLVLYGVEHENETDLLHSGIITRWIAHIKKMIDWTG